MIKYKKIINAVDEEITREDLKKSYKQGLYRVTDGTKYYFGMSKDLTKRPFTNHDSFMNFDNKNNLELKVWKLDNISRKELIEEERKQIKQLLNLVGKDRILNQKNCGYD